MQLSLSVRIAEDFQIKDQTRMEFGDLARMAANCGYDAICMRATQASVSTEPGRLREMRGLLDELGLAVTMTTGDVPLAANDDKAGLALRDIGPYLDLAEAFGAPLVRVMIKTAEDVEWARQAAARAAERGLTLAHQMHTGTLVETIDEALEMATEIDSPAFGITYEPASLMACGEEWGRGAIARLAPLMVNVYLQNHRLDPEGKDVLRRRGGPVRVTNLPLDAGGGVDLDEVFGGLREVGYDGPVTVHQAALPGVPIPRAARRYFEILAPYVRG
jgi:sugar phosphate isomerase/epimerase